MNIVVKPINDVFLTRVAFPAFEQGVQDATAGLELLRSAVVDERTDFLLTSLLDTGVHGSFFTLDAERWLEAVYRILFCRWEEKIPGSWSVQEEPAGYANSFDHVLQLTLLLEDPHYPYGEIKSAEPYRDDFLASLPRRGSLCGLVCGVWDPLPPFAPDQVLSTQGRGFYRPQEGLAVAEWSYRSASQVSTLSALLTGQLAALLERERARLAPLPLKESQALMAHWLREAPLPTLAVAFSGLGLAATGWVQELGALVRLVREAAAKGEGLSCLITHTGRQMADGMDEF